MRTAQLPTLFAAQNADSEALDAINRAIAHALEVGDLTTADTLLVEQQGILATMRARTATMRRIAEGVA